MIDKIISNEVNFISLQETKDGISDTTYILTDNSGKKYICKLYERASIEKVKKERDLLLFLENHLCVPSPLFKLYKYNNKPLQFYSFIKGNSPQKPNTNQIKQIAQFLAKFHTISPKIGSLSKGIYTHESIKTMLCNLPFEFQKRYELVKNIQLFDDGLIHGDLFPDNSKFIKDELIGVFDFIESSIGDFSFDLAVVANSWCRNDSHILILLETYNKFTPKVIALHHLLKMMKLSALFYALQRFHGGVKDYKEYLIKFDSINN